MMISVFLSGLGGAVIGSLISGCFLLYQQKKQRRDEMHAAARAVLSEMLENAKLAVFAVGLVQPPIPFELRDRFSRNTWSEQLPLVAQLLNWHALMKVRRAYDSGAELFKIAETSIKEGTTSQQVTQIKESFLGVAREFKEGLRLFPLDRLLKDEERKDFDSELETLLEHIQSSKEVIEASKKGSGLGPEHQIAGRT